MPRIIVTATAVVLALFGMILLFVPGALQQAYGAEGSATIVFQQLGFALLGLAVANWIIRNSPVGGIYGRAIVSADLVYFVATFFLYISWLAQGESNSMVWVNLLVSGVFALLFALMVFGRVGRG